MKISTGQRFVILQVQDTEDWGRKQKGNTAKMKGSVDTTEKLTVNEVQLDDSAAKCADSRKSCKTSKTENCTTNRVDAPADKTARFDFPDFVSADDREMLSAFSDTDLEVCFAECLPIVGPRRILLGAIKAREKAQLFLQPFVENYLAALEYLPLATAVEVNNPPSNRERLIPSKSFVDSLGEPILSPLSEAKILTEDDTEIVKNRILNACEKLLQPGSGSVDLEDGELLVVAAMMSLLHLGEALGWRADLLKASVEASKRARETVDTFVSVLEDLEKDTEPKS